MDSRLRGNDELVKRWNRMRDIRLIVNEAIEPPRRQKIIRYSLAADVALSLQARDYEWFADSRFTAIAILARVLALGKNAHTANVPSAAAPAKVPPTPNP